MSDAEMNPEEVDYINVHGTSTPVKVNAGETRLFSTISQQK